MHQSFLLAFLCVSVTADLTSSTYLGQHCTERNEVAHLSKAVTVPATDIHDAAEL